MNRGFSGRWLARVAATVVVAGLVAVPGVAQADGPPTPTTAEPSVVAWTAPPSDVDGGTTTSNSAGIAWQGPDGARYWYRLSSTATGVNPAYLQWQSNGTAQAQYTGLPDGTYAFTVEAVVDAVAFTPSTWTWTVDTSSLPPPPVQTAGPATGSVTNQATSIFTFSSPEPVVFCQVSGPGISSPLANRGSCGPAGSYSFTASEDGTYTLQAYATDGSLFSNATPVTWTVDTTAPTVTASVAATSVADSDVQTVTIASPSDPTAATFTCQLFTAGVAEPQDLGTCTSPYDVGPLPVGSYTLYVYATDPAGNTSTAATVSWTVSGPLPAKPVMTTNDASTYTRSTSASIAWEQISGLSYECQLAGPGRAQSYAACTSPETYNDLGDGHYTFSVLAIDGSGQPSAEPGTYEWVVDTTPPDAPTITAGPTAADGAPWSIAYRGDEAGLVFDCELDGVALPAAACPAEKPTGTSETVSTTVGTATLADPSDGRNVHTFRVWAEDLATNKSAEAATWVWAATAVAPPTAAPPDSQAGAGTIGFAAAAGWDDPAVTFECALDGGAYTPCASPFSYAGLADGPHTLDVEAFVGSDHSPATHVAWTVAAPTPSLTGPTSVPAQQPTTFVAAIDQAGGVSPTSCQFDFGDGTVVAGALTADGSTCSASHAFSSPGADTVTVTIFDAAGDVRSTQLAVTVTAVPRPVITSPADGSVVPEWTTVTGTASGSWVFVYADGRFVGVARVVDGRWSAGVPLPVGGHVALTARQLDGDGRPSDSSDPVDVLVYGYTFGGSFAIGAGHAAVGQQVTFWGSQWSKVNGLGPASFKGFTDAAPTDPAWTARPGDSAAPPWFVPRYVLVVITDSVTKHGSSVRGDVVGHAVVRVDPGYSANPGHAGTGTVVALLP